MKVTLLHSTPLWVNAHGARTCWDSGNKSDTKQMQEDIGWVMLQDMSEESFFEKYGKDVNDVDGYACGPKDAELIDRVGNKFRHASILEHVSYNFHIEGISRALLQELARHRMASLSVKSTRYTLKELKSEEPFYDFKSGSVNFSSNEWQRASKYLVWSGEKLVDLASVMSLENLRGILIAGISNDRAKYCLPESYKTELTWSINMRSLQNFISLRSDKSALWEIQDLANMVYNALPEDHKYLYANHIKGAE